MKKKKKNQVQIVKENNIPKENKSKVSKLIAYLNSNKLSVFMLTFTFIVVTMLLSIEVYDLLSRNYEVGQVSSEKIKSSRKFINRFETNKRRDNASNSVQSYYKVDTDITEGIHLEIEYFFNLLELERGNYNTYLQYIEEVGGISSYESLESEENSILPKYDIFNEELLKILTYEEVIHLCKLSSDNYTLYKGFVVQIIEDTLNQGIKNDSILNTFLLVEDYIKKQNLSDIDTDIIYKIIINFLRANLIVDELATEKARAEAIENVEVVYYLENQTIVDEGSIITEETYMALEDLGYTEKNITELIISYLGVIVLNLIFTLFIILYVYLYDKKYLYSREIIALVCSLYLLNVIFTIVLKGTWINYMPLYATVYLLATFIDKKLVAVISMSLIFLLGNFIPITSNEMLFLFLTVNMEILFVKIFSEKNFIIFSTVIVSLFFGLIYILVFLVDGYKLSELQSDFYIIPSTVFISIIFSYGVAPAFSTTFGLLTNARLLGFTRPDQPLIRRLTLEASGTYQHSLVVANLSEEAALAIGANSALCRTASYYHDIGKLKNPMYYGENQNGYNPHDNLSPIESARIILNHTVYGQELAKQYKLPKEIIDIIPQHHGSTKVGYFYSKALNSEKLKNKVTDKMFTYTGDIPQSKEAAIIMLADTAEAAVRSVIYKVKDFNEVEEFLSTLINGKIKEGQLLDSGLTFKDIEKIKISFIQIFKGMYHNRVEYPAKNEVRDEK